MSFTPSKFGTLQYNNVLKAIQNDNEYELEKAINCETTFEEYSNGLVTIKNSELYFDGEPINGKLANRIIEFILNDKPATAMINFLEKLIKNPSKSCFDNLFTFLEYKGLPILDDGCFIGYKAVREDLRDIYSGKVQYEIGKEFRIARNKVDDNSNRGCSYGVHLGTEQYARNYGGSNSKLLIVRCSPEDVVSVPFDCNCQKIRTCALTPLGVTNHTLPSDYVNNDYINREDDWEDFVDDEFYEDDEDSEDDYDEDYEEDFTSDFIEDYDDSIEFRGF